MCIVSVNLVRAARRASDFPKVWSETKLASEVARYQKFLLLARRYPGQPLAPTYDIDQIWHLHMQHPQAYYDDCQRLLGGIFDHDGGFGSDAAELPELKRVFQTTADLWEREFNEPYVEGASDPRVTNCWHDCQGRCWHACSSRHEERPAEQMTNECGASCRGDCGARLAAIRVSREAV